ncbi:MAG: PilZ domain-containing protein [Candidatus Omnitrophica bacterium]|nr:PilZ domain-containing protein [Candidatus Omnitrophota bacterium]
MSVSIQNYSGKEKRVHRRWDIENRIFFRKENNSTEQLATTKDLSCSGTCFLSKEKVRCGQKLKLSIYLSEAQAITVQAKVMWVQKADDIYCIGANFSDISEDEQAFILEHAYESNPDTVVNHWFKDWNG